MTLPDNDLMTDTSLYIRELQNMLRKLSFYLSDIPPVNPDGVFGPETTQAVAAFQRLFNLPVTGQVDEETWDALNEEYNRILALEQFPTPLQIFPSADTVLKKGDTGDAVFALQMILNALARRYYNLLSFPLSGEMDDLTVAAVRNLQEYLRLPVNGEVDKETWDRIAWLYNTL